MTDTMRSFPGGATRNILDGKLSYIRFLSPHVMTRYCEYLEKHRDTPAGRRDQDNWKAGIPIPVYMDSLGRHFWEAWTQHEDGRQIDIDTLCAILFNVQGLLYERLKQDRQTVPEWENCK